MGFAFLFLRFMLTMSKKRFAISGGITTLVMLLLSFLWHGVILNDFKNLPVKEEVFLVLSVVAYIGIGFLLNFLLLYTKTENDTLAKRVMIGGAFGFFIYLLIFTLGISYQSRGVEHVLIDFIWQMIEQSAGALTAGFIFRIYERMDAIAETE